MDIKQQSIARVRALLDIFGAVGVVLVDGEEVFNKGGMVLRAPEPEKKPGKRHMRPRGSYKAVYAPLIGKLEPGETFNLSTPDGADYNGYTQGARKFAEKMWGTENIVHQYDPKTRSVFLLRIM